ncbi:MAG: hypothetical protein J6Q24_04505 [Clostridia bacterium]|nr:hypothetical protein [Clostridia bacterium]
MLKKIIVSVLILVLCLAFASCDSQPADQSTPSPNESTKEESKSQAEESNKQTEESKNDIVKDTIPPAFIGAVDGALPSITQNANEEINILAGIIARDNVTPDDEVIISVSDTGGYNFAIPGTYTITLQAKDSAGNVSTAIITVTVKEVVTAKYLSLKNIYTLGGEDALSYTASGTKFRTADSICVLDKETFVSQYNTYSPDHTNNGGVPFFPNGVIIITDKDYVVKQVRIAAGELIQIEEDGSVKNSGFSWTNAIDASSGGGMFKGILTDIEKVIPDGGYLFFVGNPGEQTCRIFLIKNLFCSSYESGPITLDMKNIDISGLVISLD